MLVVCSLYTGEDTYFNFGKTMVLPATRDDFFRPSLTCRARSVGAQPMHEAAFRADSVAMVRGSLIICAHEGLGFLLEHRDYIVALGRSTTPPLVLQDGQGVQPVVVGHR